MTTRYMLSKEPSCLNDYVLSGEIDILVAQDFEQQLEKTLTNTSGIINRIDCTNLTYIDSQGLNALCRMDRKLRAIGSRIRLFNANSNIRKILLITGLEEFFYETKNKNILMDECKTQFETECMA